jgi:hypothetical protein
MSARREVPKPDGEAARRHASEWICRLLGGAAPTHTDLWPLASGIRCPVLVLLSMEDDVATPRGEAGLLLCGRFRKPRPRSSFYAASDIYHACQRIRDLDWGFRGQRRFLRRHP